MGRGFVYLLVVPVLMIGALGAQAALNVDVYSGHTVVGGGAPYSGLVGSFSSPDVMFATNTGYGWHPFGLPDFGADITGFLNVAADGTYGFTLNSDDGSLLYIEGNLVVDDGGGHAPQIGGNDVFLEAGCHSFEVQFFEDFGGPSGVDLYLPSGVTYCDKEIPEASSILLALPGLGALGGLRLRRRK